MLVTLCRPVLLSNPYPAELVDVKGRSTEITSWPVLSVPFATDDFPLTFKVSGWELRLGLSEEDGICRQTLNLTKGFLHTSDELIPRICVVMQPEAPLSPARNLGQYSPETAVARILPIDPRHEEMTRLMSAKAASDAAHDLSIHELHHALTQFASETKQTARWRQEAQEEVRRLQCDVDDWRQKWDFTEERLCEEMQECSVLESQRDSQSDELNDRRNWARQHEELLTELTEMRSQNHNLNLSSSRFRVESEEETIARHEVLESLESLQSKAESTRKAYQDLQSSFDSYREETELNEQSNHYKEEGHMLAIQQELEEYISELDIQIAAKSETEDTLRQLEIAASNDIELYRSELEGAKSEVRRAGDEQEEEKTRYDNLLTALQYEHQKSLADNENLQEQIRCNEGEWLVEKSQLLSELDLLRPMADKCRSLNRVSSSLQSVVDGLQEQLVINDERIFSLDKDLRSCRHEIQETRQHSASLKGHLAVARDRCESQARQCALGDNQGSQIRILQNALEKSDMQCLEFEKEKTSILMNQKARQKEIKNLSDQLSDEKMVSAHLREEVSELRADRTDRTRAFADRASRLQNELLQVRRSSSQRGDLPSTIDENRISVAPVPLSSTIPTAHPADNKFRQASARRLPGADKGHFEHVVRRNVDAGRPERSSTTEYFEIS
eukprot:GEMP01021619.1.p1 GENE.GEMP01021619.1~~GEMP01021619.1.p1  ORF type:complete len:674 (+),score=152.38 GEMP01021619.1:69-2090(+)